MGLLHKGPVLHEAPKGLRGSAKSPYTGRFMKPLGAVYTNTYTHVYIFGLFSYRFGGIHDAHTEEASLRL